MREDLIGKKIKKITKFGKQIIENLINNPPRVNPHFVLERLKKERPGLSFGIIKFKQDTKNKIYRYQDSHWYWNCISKRKRVFVSCKGFKRCANFDRIVHKNGLEELNRN